MKKESEKTKKESEEMKKESEKMKKESEKMKKDLKDLEQKLEKAEQENEIYRNLGYFVGRFLYELAIKFNFESIEEFCDAYDYGEENSDLKYKIKALLSDSGKRSAFREYSQNNPEAF